MRAAGIEGTRGKRVKTTRRIRLLIGIRTSSGGFPHQRPINCG